MPVRLLHTGTVYAQNFEFAQGTVALGALPGGRFSVADFSTGVSHVVAPGPNGATLDDTWWHEAAPRVAYDVAGHPGALPPELVTAFQEAWQTGDSSGHRAYLTPGGRQGDSATVLAAALDGQRYLFAAASDGSGLTVFRLNADGSVQSTRSAADDDTTYLKNVSDMALIDTDGGPYLFAGSATEHGLSGFRVARNGALQPVESLGMADRLPVQTVTALEVATVAGQTFLLVAAAGSSSLTVLSVSADGALSVTDHVIDDRNTRFAGAGQLEVVTVSGHVFVLAAGRDAGLSLLRLTAEGRLVHHDTLADGLTMALDGVSGLAAQANAAGIDILTTAAGEAGLSQFRVEFSAPGRIEQRGSGVITGSGGDDLLSLRNDDGDIRAGAGEDVLSDGPGADTLRGGPGADIFVMRADGQRDLIADIAGEDVLDLSAWPLLRSAGQITVTPTGQGAVLIFGEEELELHSADSQPLEAEEIAALLPPLLSHVAVELGPLLSDPPGPDPDPFPDTVPPVPRAEPPLERPAPEEGLTLIGTAADDFLQGGERGDVLAGRAGDDTLLGGGGDDMLSASDGDDLAEGGPGRDNIGGGQGNDTLRGQAGRDTLGGGQGNDLLQAGEGHDVMSGGPGHDVVDAGGGNDTLAGSFGADTVRGVAGDDSIGGGPGRDLLLGGGGDDILGGGEGNDTVHGGPGRDFLAGGGRHDHLTGGPGRDTLAGGPGDDRLEGGGGADLFVFNMLSAGERDVIAGFQPGVDHLRLSGVDGQGQTGRFQALDISATGQGVVLGYEGHTILLEDVGAMALSMDDFIFL